MNSAIVKYFDIVEEGASIFGGCVMAVIAFPFFLIGILVKWIKNK